MSIRARVERKSARRIGGRKIERCGPFQFQIKHQAHGRDKHEGAERIFFWTMELDIVWNLLCWSTNASLSVPRIYIIQAQGTPSRKQNITHHLAKEILNLHKHTWKSEQIQNKSKSIMLRSTIGRPAMKKITLHLLLGRNNNASRSSSERSHYVPTTTSQRD